MIVSSLSQMAFKLFFWSHLQLRWVDVDTPYKRMTYKRDYSLESILWVASFCFLSGWFPALIRRYHFLQNSGLSEVRQTNLFWVMRWTVKHRFLMEEAQSEWSRYSFDSRQNTFFFFYFYKSDHLNQCKNVTICSISYTRVLEVLLCNFDFLKCAPFSRCSIFQEE